MASISFINTYPIIADSLVPVADKRFTLTYCKGDYKQTSLPVSSVGFPSTEYRVEWYKKDDLNTICSGIDTLGVVMEPSVAVALENADTTYYCVRQSTQLGCKGPWLTVQIVVYPDVTDKPAVQPVEYCQGTIPVPATVNAVNPDVTKYSLTYYRLDTAHVDGVVVKDTPLGLLASGTAWGEWGADEIAEIVQNGSELGFTPSGMETGFGFEAIMPDYTIGDINEVVAYIASAICGVALLVIFFKIVSSFKKEK